ncbi:MAG: YfhO family protein, partial [Anaerolineaceae bacterium]
GALQAINSRYESSESIYDQQNDMVTWLAGQDGLFRVYSPSYSIGQLAAVRNGLQLTDGIDPLQLQSYDRFMTQATGVTGDTYSVSIPRFATGRPEKDNEDAIPSAQLLGILNVKYIASAYPMEADGLRYVDHLSGAWIYQNELCRPRAWLQSTTELDESGANIIGYAEEIKYPDANTIQVQVSGDEGYLVLSEVAYPGWRVWIDGQRADLVVIGGLLRGVWIPGGQHTITFVFRPTLVYIGLAVSLAAMMAIVSVVIASTKQAGINV